MNSEIINILPNADMIKEYVNAILKCDGVWHEDPSNTHQVCGGN